MCSTHVVGGEKSIKGNMGCGGFDIGTAALFAVDKTEDADDIHARFLRGFDGGDGGASGGANVVDDDDVGADLVEALNATAGAVGLFGLADEESVYERIVLMVQVVPGTGAGGIRDQRVGPHGQSADGIGLREVLADQVIKKEARKATTFGMQGRGTTVDVVIGLLAAGEGEISEPEGMGRDERKEGSRMVGGHDFCTDYPLPSFFAQSRRNQTV